MRLGPALVLLAALASPAWARSEFDKLARAGLKSLQDDDAVQAEISLKRAVKLKPENADIHAALAVALALEHLRPEALEEYKTALRLDRRWIEKRKITDVASSNGWLSDAPASWDGEQEALALEVFNEPKTQSKAKPGIVFPAGWVVDGWTAHPDDVSGIHARMVYEEGKDDFGAEDPAQWWEKQVDASPERYHWYKKVEQREITRDGVPGLQVLYTIQPPRFREQFEILDVVLLKNGRYRRALYEAPLSEFYNFFQPAYKALGTLTFK